VAEAPHPGARDADAPEAGLGESVRRLAHTGVGIVRTRLDLLANELEEERARVTRMLVLGAVAAVCFAMVAIVGSLLIVVALWDTHRIAALVGLTVLYAAAGFFALSSLREVAAQRTRLFSQSLAELDKDRGHLG
jgi:uncharacterized membrane protein YqjE